MTNEEMEIVRAIATFLLTTAGSADPDARVRASADLIDRVNGLIKERDEARLGLDQALVGGESALLTRALAAEEEVSKLRARLIVGATPAPAEEGLPF